MYNHLIPSNSDPSIQPLISHLNDDPSPIPAIEHSSQQIMYIWILFYIKSEKDIM